MSLFSTTRTEVWANGLTTVYLDGKSLGTQPLKYKIPGPDFSKSMRRCEVRYGCSSIENVNMKLGPSLLLDEVYPQDVARLIYIKGPGCNDMHAGRAPATQSDHAVAERMLRDMAKYQRKKGGQDTSASVLSATAERAVNELSNVLQEQNDSSENMIYKGETDKYLRANSRALACRCAMLQQLSSIDGFKTIGIAAMLDDLGFGGAIPKDKGGRGETSLRDSSQASDSFAKCLAVASYFQVLGESVDAEAVVFSFSPTNGAMIQQPTSDYRSTRKRLIIVNDSPRCHLPGINYEDHEVEEGPRKVAIWQNAMYLSRGVSYAGAESLKDSIAAIGGVLSFFPVIDHIAVLQELHAEANLGGDQAQEANNLDAVLGLIVLNVRAHEELLRNLHERGGIRMLAWLLHRNVVFASKHNAVRAGCIVLKWIFALSCRGSEAWWGSKAEVEKSDAQSDEIDVSIISARQIIADTSSFADLLMNPALLRGVRQTAYIRVLRLCWLCRLFDSSCNSNAQYNVAIARSIGCVPWLLNEMMSQARILEKNMHPLSTVLGSNDAAGDKPQAAEIRDAFVSSFGRAGCTALREVIEASTLQFNLPVEDSHRTTFESVVVTGRTLFTILNCWQLVPSSGTPVPRKDIEIMSQYVLGTFSTEMLSFGGQEEGKQDMGESSGGLDSNHDATSGDFGSASSGSTGDEYGEAHPGMRIVRVTLLRLLLELPRMGDAGNGVKSVASHATFYSYNVVFDLPWFGNISKWSTTEGGVEGGRERGRERGSEGGREGEQKGK